MGGSATLGKELEEAKEKRRVSFSFYDSVHDATLPGSTKEKHERKRMAGVLESWTKSRELPIDEDLRTLWQRLQTHVRDVTHLHRPPPKTESTLPANMVEHLRHVAAQLAPNAPLPSLPFRTLYLGGPEPTGNTALDR